MITKRKGQALMDYAVLIAMVAISLLVMSGYVFRSIDSRVRHVWADLYDPLCGVR